MLAAWRSRAWGRSRKRSTAWKTCDAGQRPVSRTARLRRRLRERPESPVGAAPPWSSASGSCGCGSPARRCPAPAGHCKRHQFHRRARRRASCGGLANPRGAARRRASFRAEDELNCGGCGYDSCREFGIALLGQKAERAMCVTYMRQLAHKKANALIQKMPSAVVIVNESLRIIEFNAAFAKLFAPRQSRRRGRRPALEGIALAEVMPFATPLPQRPEKRRGYSRPRPALSEHRSCTPPFSASKNTASSAASCRTSPSRRCARSRSSARRAK